MSDTRRWQVSQLEDRASKGWMPFWVRCLYSIAVSLKRLADKEQASMELKLPDDTSTLYHQVGQIAWEAGRNFQHGMRTDR